MKDQKFSPTPLAKGVALALGATVLSPAVAQEPIEEIIAVGVRGSLTSSMNLKRSAQGVKDGIIAEDIGKVPDTNLAESMQRITGVSIDRTAIGEGSQVTVRGVGPNFNLVTLNGRQMPGSGLEDTAPSDSRAFDFANLASEAVSAIEIFKTSQARLPTGGIGATVNIKTTRPLEHSDTIFNLGAKAVSDSSVENGDDWTPELSGIYSTQTTDGKFGVSISASYQDRNLGYNQAGASSGFQSFLRGEDAGAWGGVPQEFDSEGNPNPAFGILTNPPQDGDVYSVPQNILYSFNDIQRERTNAQLTLQFAPNDNITATLDYTYSEQEVQTQRAELSAWFNYLNNGPIEFTDGPNAAPVIWTEQYGTPVNPNPADVGSGGGDFGVKNENDSIGFNLEWLVNDQLALEFDYHNSTAKSGRASPYGTNATQGITGFYRGTTTGDFSKDLPVLGMDLVGVSELDPSQTLLQGSAYRNGMTDAEISQARIMGTFDFDDDYSLDFGVDVTEVDNRTAFATVQNNTWGGAGSPDDLDDDLFFIDSKSPSQYFSNLSGSNNPLLFPQILRWDWDTVLEQATAAGIGDCGDLAPNCFQASDVWDTDRRTSEDSFAAYIQFNANFEIGDKPAALAAGIRYEQTDVTSSALVPIPTGVTWVAPNEYDVIIPSDNLDFTELEGDYDYVLPSLDFNVELTEDVILRLGYSQTIGRPGWGNIQGGQTLNALAREIGGTGSQGSPELLPLESENIDLSVEWYYGDGSYLSVAYFSKDIENFVTFTEIVDTPFDLPTPFEGARYNEAVAALGSDDLVLIRDYICQNYGDTPQVRECAIDAGTGFLSGKIDGIAGEDPAMVFRINAPSNASGSETVDGWELALQHFFGDTGFGVNVNYTIVEATTEYDFFDLGAQEPLLGISDSANFIGFWENDQWSVKLAYNWRDEYLDATVGGNNYQQPYIVEEYGQFDANVSFNLNENLTFSFEAINITDETTRVSGRNDNVAFFVTTLGPRYMIGARYDFF